MILSAQPDIEVVGEAADGREAVHLAVKLRPGVVVMDIAMPELNGVEAAAQIHEINPRTGIVVLSMHATGEHIYRAMQAGVRGYLLKESAGSEVIEAVRAVYDGRRYLSQKIADLVVDNYVAHRKAADAGSPLERLSDREREVLQLVVEGRTSAEIADTLALSPKTVDTYRSRIMDKLGIADLPGLVRFAIQHGLTPLE
jgi:DNA-binding NarL/FixJ family response regulator